MNYPQMKSVASFRKEKKKSSFQITHMIGNKKDKAKIYRNIHCPQNFLLEAALQISEREDFDNQDSEIISALVNNNMTPTDALILLEQVIKKKNKETWHIHSIENHIQHPKGIEKKISQIKEVSGFEKFFKKVSLHNDKMYDLLYKNCFLSGNSLTSFVASFYSFSDFDFFFKTAQSAETFLRHVLSLSSDDEIRNKDIIVKNDSIIVDSKKLIKFEWDEYTIVVTKNAITFRSNNSRKSYPFQFVTKRCGDPDRITSTFDFAHCKGYYDILENKLEFPYNTLLSITGREVKFDGGTNPLNSLLRIKKLNYQGWHIPKTEYLKVGFSLSQTDLSNPEILKESLSGFYGLQIDEIWDETLGQKDKITFEDLCDFVDELDFLIRKSLK